MPRTTKTGNLRKLCDCARQKDCAHPWYVDFQTRGRRYRANLDKLSGKHLVDFTDAKAEAMRAIVAWQNGRNPHELQPEDQPTLARLIEAYRARAGAPDSEKYHEAVINVA